MPIEFRCTKCSKLLRTPDETGGKQARCPQCGTILSIPVGRPAAAEPAPALSPAAPLGEGLAFAPARPASANPYQAPMTSEAAPPQISAGKLVFGDAYGRAWHIFSRRAPLCFLVVVVAFALSYGVAFGLGLASTQLVLLGVPWALSRAGSFILAMLFQWWLTSGQTYFFLNVAGGKQANLANVFAGTRGS